MTIVTTAPGQLEIIPISDSEWRVSDPRRRHDDALCLVGFVQRVEGAFEVTVIGRPREREYFRSLGEATQFLGTATNEFGLPAGASPRRPATQGGV
jgi:hypothetical protein